MSAARRGKEDRDDETGTALAQAGPGALVALLVASAGWADEALGDPTPNGENMRIQYLRPAWESANRAEAWLDVPTDGLYVATGKDVQFRAVRDDGQPWPEGQPVWSGTALSTNKTGETVSVTFTNQAADMNSTVTVVAKVDGTAIGSVGVICHGASKLEGVAIEVPNADNDFYKDLEPIRKAPPRET